MKRDQVPDAVPESLVAEHGRRESTAFRTETLGELRISEQLRQGIRQSFDIIGFDEEATLAIGHNLGNRASTLGHHCQPSSSCFDVDESEPFSLRRVDRRPRRKSEHGGSPIQSLELSVSHRPDERHRSLDARRVREGFEP